MKKKKDVLKGRVVRVPADLTSDPHEKRGWMGIIESSDHKEGVIYVGFDDGTICGYDFGCLEILHSRKTLSYHLNAKLKELNMDESESMRRVIRLDAIGEHEAAFREALASTKVRDICITDTATYYGIRKSIKKHLGI